MQNPSLPHPPSFTDSFSYYRQFLHATHLDPTRATTRTADLPRESSVCIPGHVTVPKLSSTVCQDGNTQPGCCRCLARPVCFALVGWSLLRERAYFVGLVITSFPSFPSFTSLLTRFRLLFSRTRYAPIHTRNNHWYVEFGKRRLSERKKEKKNEEKASNQTCLGTIQLLVFHIAGEDPPCRVCSLLLLLLQLRVS